MPVRPNSARTGRAAAVVATAGIVSLTALAAGPAAADPGATTAPRGPVTKDVTFTCEFPMVGARPTQAKVNATFPDSAKVGESINVTDFKVDVTIDEQTADALRLIGGASVEGTAATGVDLNVNGTDLGVTLNGLSIPSTPVPESGPLPTQITGAVPGLTVKQPGQVTFAVGSNFVGKITPKKADGTETELGTFDLPCTLDQGQDPSLATVQVQ
ncbi:hypothetical protein A8924_2742 [Saccharopolyspora erythraea NRRL 2338]|uniref:Uncharacterized protein n=2 Tax=Saccharopolyspora erythraea TaxID=1836 RepID=A4FC74_SACEN|nr:DUF6801 domain-containing protein [Saccharopolyspora erythraea]EQD84482.1 hypothetical protein N599_19810 [Saccharopolyspora erythraea D]PFG95410.1 hypothetical protein A8924_2742 [Saccharopolyspora erythraea NRRL 2338]QRK92049.1 hypothetical protein JQX30_12250 [Saccharopolyspora erythraea]CAM01649.1 hypothetical protein SACE_2349 [Saccharopolyspora erythraea NRRL 2338]